MDTLEISEPFLPDFAAIQVEGGHPDGVVVGKAHEHAFAVAGRRAGSLAVLGMLLHEVPAVDLPLPELFARVDGVAERRLLLCLVIRRHEEDSVAPDRGRTVPPTGDTRLPDNVLVLAPLDRRLLGRCGLSVLRGSAPPGPIVRPGLHGGKIVPTGTRCTGNKDCNKERQHTGVPGNHAENLLRVDNPSSIRRNRPQKGNMLPALRGYWQAGMSHDNAHTRHVGYCNRLMSIQHLNPTEPYRNRLRRRVTPKPASMFLLANHCKGYDFVVSLRILDTSTAVRQTADDEQEKGIALILRPLSSPPR